VLNNCAFYRRSFAKIHQQKKPGTPLIVHYFSINSTSKPHSHQAQPEYPLQLADI
jgi:hypothetical protein